jgi:hypothetical protein
LVAVEPSSLAVLACVKTDDYSGAAWQAVFGPFTNLEFVMSDGAPGIAAGVQAVRQERGTTTILQQGLDLFHTARDAEQRLGIQWRQAEAVWDKAVVASAQTAAVKRQGRDARSASGREQQRWNDAKRQFAAAEQADAAWRRIHGAMSVFRPDGTLNERSWAEAEIAAALPMLVGPDWAKVRNAVTDPRSLTFVDRLHRRLSDAVPEARLREACVQRWWLRHRRSAAAVDQPTAVIAAVLDDRIRTMSLSAEEQGKYDRVKAILETTVRASSAVEGANSVLRMHQGRHRKMTQGLLDLKRLYWNCRRLQTGRRRDRSPYELLGVQLPSTDFWTLLQMPPAELKQRTQELSMQQVPE